ncbi:hypothetical protein [Microcella sp.]|uniref:hypothetical protein n=1 Tax=Microcella sp. TaxID=1913979 RepID=UPI00391C8BE8
MPRPVHEWWARRQWATGRAEPYPIGRFRDAWAPYLPLVAQFRPERNAELLLSQIPPAADVYLVWVCAIGHDFVATPAEQRARPGARHARGDWCPVCATPSAAPTAARRYPRPEPTAAAAPADDGPLAPLHGRVRSVRALRSVGDPVRPRRAADPRPTRPGTAFVSAHASSATSGAQERLRALVGERLACDLSSTAVSVAQPFHGRFEVWPDLILPELAVAVEYDTVGRAGDEHVGRRERSDRRKDALLRAVGWEVVRLRHAPLRPLGPHDLVVTGVTARAVDALVDRLGEIRGALFVGAYDRRAESGA